MKEWLSQLGQQLPQIALGFLAAHQGGPVAAGAFQQGLYESQQRRQALARQAQLDEEHRQLQASQEGRAWSAEARAGEAEARAEETARINRLMGALNYLDKYSQGQAETTLDPTAAENAILGRAASLESQFGVPQGQLSGAVQNMAPAISRRKKKLAQELYEGAEKEFGREQVANDAITLHTDAFGPVKPSQLRAMYMSATTPTGEQARPYVKPLDVPNTEEERDVANALALAAQKKGAQLNLEEQQTARREAIGAFRSAGRKPEDTDMADLRKQIMQLQIQQLQQPGDQQSVLDTRPDPATANTPDPRTGLTPNALFQNGATFALTGRMPQMGMGSRGRAAATRTAIQNTGAALAARAGVDLPTLQAEYRANAGTLSKLLPVATATAGSAGAATDNLQLALSQSPKVTRTDSAWVNHVANNFVRGATSAATLTQFEVYIYTAAREYAKVVSGSAASVAGLTDSAGREASKLLNAAQSPDAFAAAVQAMQNDMANVVRNQQTQLAGVSHAIANFFGAVNGVGPVQTGGPGGAGGTGVPRKNPYRP